MSMGQIAESEGSAVGQGPDLGKADVLLVGAGASSAFAAVELARAGFRVVCLEQGDWTLRTEFAGARKEWELKAQKDWHPNPNKRARASDYPVSYTHLTLPTKRIV